MTQMISSTGWGLKISWLLSCGLYQTVYSFTYSFWVLEEPAVLASWLIQISWRRRQQGSSEAWQPPHNYTVLYLVHQQREASLDQDSVMKEHSDKNTTSLTKVLVNKWQHVYIQKVLDKYCGYKYSLVHSCSEMYCYQYSLVHSCSEM